MLTKDIEEKLNQSTDFSEELIENNAPPKLYELLNHYINEKKMTKAEVIRKLNIDRNYGYCIFNGTRNPTRNCLIRLSLIFELNVEQINYLMRLARNPLFTCATPETREFSMRSITTWITLTRSTLSGTEPFRDRIIKAEKNKPRKMKCPLLLDNVV